MKWEVWKFCDTFKNEIELNFSNENKKIFINSSLKVEFSSTV